MKKGLILSLVLVMVVTLFVACGGGGDSAGYKDGSYKAVAAEADEYGWTDFVEITIKDGKISEVNYDSSNADDMLKSEDEAYKEAMTGAGSDTYPSKFSQELEDALLDIQDVTKVEVIAGASLASNSFKKLANELLSKNAMEGNTDTLTVE